MGASEREIVWFTFGMAVLATVAILPFGVPWLGSSPKNLAGKALVETLVALPLVMPPVATGLILLKLLGRKGPIGNFLHDHFDLDMVFTWRAVVAAMAAMSFPLLVRGTRIASKQSIRVSNRWRHAGRLARPGFPDRHPAAGRPWDHRRQRARLCPGVGRIGATILVAGNIPGKTTTLSVAIYSDIQIGHDSDAFRLLVISVILAFAAVLLSEWISNGACRRHESRIQDIALPLGSMTLELDLTLDRKITALSGHRAPGKPLRWSSWQASGGLHVGPSPWMGSLSQMPANTSLCRPATAPSVTCHRTSPLSSSHRGAEHRLRNEKAGSLRLHVSRENSAACWRSNICSTAPPLSIRWRETARSLCPRSSHLTQAPTSR